MAPTNLSGIPAYSAAVAAETLGAGKDYVASCPLFWLNMSFELQPNVPRYHSRVNTLQDHFYSEPCTPKEVIVVMPIGNSMPPTK